MRAARALGLGRRGAEVVPILDGRRGIFDRNSPNLFNDLFLSDLGGRRGSLNEPRAHCKLVQYVGVVFMGCPEPVSRAQ